MIASTSRNRLYDVTDRSPAATAMEKYRSTADAGTGIHPFIPAPNPPVSLTAILLTPLRLLLIVLSFALPARTASRARLAALAIPAPAPFVHPELKRKPTASAPLIIVANSPFPFVDRALLVAALPASLPVPRFLPLHGERTTPPIPPFCVVLPEISPHNGKGLLPFDKSVSTLLLASSAKGATVLGASIEYRGAAGTIPSTSVESTWVRVARLLVGGGRRRKVAMRIGELSHPGSPASALTPDDMRKRLADIGGGLPRLNVGWTEMQRFENEWLQAK